MRGNLIESEKLLERKLNEGVKELGGWSLKLLSDYVSGLPDRICLIPYGIVFFVEVKTTNRKPRKIQLFIHDKLRKLGFRVEVVDSSEAIEKLLKEYEKK